MLNHQEAKELAEKLHPAFCGFLKEDCIKSSDILGLILHLVKKEVVEIIWTEGTQGTVVSGLKLAQNKPYWGVEKIFIQEVFQHQPQITLPQLQKLIYEGKLHQTIDNHLHTIAHLPAIKQEFSHNSPDFGSLIYSLGDTNINKIEGLGAYNNHFIKLLLSMLIFTAIVLGVIYYLFFITLDTTTQVFILPVLDLNTILFIIGSLLLLLGVVYLSQYSSIKMAKYSFKEEIIPVAKYKYSLLYTYLEQNYQTKNLPENEFLAFALAFNLDKEWQQKFGLHDLFSDII